MAIIQRVAEKLGQSRHDSLPAEAFALKAIINADSRPVLGNVETLSYELRQIRDLASFVQEAEQVRIAVSSGQGG